MIRAAKFVLPALALAGIAWWAAASFSGASVSARELQFAPVERGDIAASIGAGGKVIPAYEEVINSPVASRIVEVRHRPGDIVEAGTSLLVLDLEATRVATQKMVDQLNMRRLELEQQRANDRTAMSRLDMDIKVGAMKLRRLEAELSNERYLDSIGSGTTDKVREAEFALRSAELELEQLKKQRTNEADVRRAAEAVKQLEIEVLAKETQLAQRTLADADIRAPRRGTVTRISSTIGSQIGQGEVVAAVADLGHYKVEGEIADSYSSAITAGARATVRVGRTDMDGTVVSVTPAANSGVITFTVALDCDSLEVLRPGLRPEVHVINGLKTDVLRIPNGSYYRGPGRYALYTRNADGTTLSRKNVELGAASMDHVEVISGLNPGETVALNVPDKVNGNETIKVK